MITSINSSLLLPEFEPPVAPQCERETTVFQETMANNRMVYDRIFAPFINRMYFLYIDRNKWIKPEGMEPITKLTDAPQVASRFDLDEPGYRQGMELGFEYIRNTFGLRFNIGNLIELHNHCVHEVYRDRWKLRQFEKGLCTGAGYKIDTAAVTEAAKRNWELKKLIAPLALKDKSGYLSVLVNNQVLSKFQEDDPESIERVNGFFNTYYEEIEKARDDDAKLTAMVNLCSSLEIDHIFSDGNQRTIAFALLNKLLAENGFPPVILKDPTMFDGYYSPEEMVELVKEGLSFVRDFLKEA